MSDDFDKNWDKDKLDDLLEEDLLEEELLEAELAEESWLNPEEETTLEPLDQDQEERRERLNKHSKQSEGSTRLPSRTRRWIVRALLLLFPLIALGVLFYLFVWPQFHHEMQEEISFDTVEVNEVGSVSMQNPTYRAFDDNQNPYVITAKSATRDINNPDRLELEKPEASMDLKDGDRIELAADKGLYEQEGGALALEGNVRLYEKTGYELLTQAVYFDLEQGLVEAPNKVRGLSPRGDLEAEALEIRREEGRVMLKGRSKVILR